MADEAAAAASGERSAPPPARLRATPELCLTQLNYAAEEMGLSSQEILVLRSLQ